jgi:DDE domain
VVEDPSCVVETYLKVARRWVYLYRAIDQHGQVIDVLVSQKSWQSWVLPASSTTWVREHLSETNVMISKDHLATLPPLGILAFGCIAR